ncbi:MarR family transcriptional regulator [Paraburkholderia sp.]|uniref:MarR family transcriptional regulator n=1 Tax=Paraburkholderia sp. TaxID=1926495 RepID=UPI003C78E922
MPTQREIADHLGIDQSAVSRMLDRLGIDWRIAPLHEVRVAYLDHLRGVAAGRTGEDGLDLASERAMTERVTREIKLLELAEKRGELVSAAQLEAGYGQMIDSFQSDLLAVPEKIADELRTLYGIDVDVELINVHIFNAIEQLSRYDPDGDGSAQAAREAADAADANDVDQLVTSLSSPVGEGFGETGEVQP